MLCWAESTDVSHPEKVILLSIDDWLYAALQNLSLSFKTYGQRNGWKVHESFGKSKQ